MLVRMVIIKAHKHRKAWHSYYNYTYACTYIRMYISTGVYALAFIPWSVCTSNKRVNRSSTGGTHIVHPEPILFRGVLDSHVHLGCLRILQSIPDAIETQLMLRILPIQEYTHNYIITHVHTYICTVCKYVCICILILYIHRSHILYIRIT